MERSGDGSDARQDVAVDESPAGGASATAASVASCKSAQRRTDVVNSPEVHNRDRRDAAAEPAVPPSVQSTEQQADAPRHRKSMHQRLIALFGSSLNPVTRAHGDIVRALLELKHAQHAQDHGGGAAGDNGDSGGDDSEMLDRIDPERPLFDGVWILPVFSHPDVEKYRFLCDVPDQSPEQAEQFDIFLKKKALRDSFDDRVALCRVRRRLP
jgi:hypothetical protein